MEVYSGYTISREYLSSIKEELLLLLPELGNNISFHDDVWFYDKKIKSAGHNPHNYKIYFTATPAEFRDIVKYFCLLDTSQVSTKSGYVYGINIFLNFLLNNCQTTQLSKVDKRVISNFKSFLSHTHYAKSTKESIWTSLNQFFKILCGWPEMPEELPTNNNNPFSRKNVDRRIEGKYAPDQITKQLDKIFKDKRFPLHHICSYWLLRSIPSRVSEVTGLPLDCLKPFKDSWVLSMPTWKLSGKYLEPQIRHIYIKEEGHGKFILDLVRAQQEVALRLQSSLPAEKRGMLFTYQQQIILWQNYISTGELIIRPHKKSAIANQTTVLTILRNYCRYNQIRDEKNQPYVITSHQLRHNGITDRFYEGFNEIEVRDMTGHHSTDGYRPYFHRLPKQIKEKQDKVLSKRIEYPRPNHFPIFFRGRILNMDEATEKRLLQNPRAHRIGRIGICSDITSCRSGLFNCLSCESFVPNADELDYFQHQVIEWESKVLKFGEHKFLKENAELNLRLHKEIVEKIENTLAEGKVIG